MFFHSPEFLIGFLPMVLVVYFALQKRGLLRAAIHWLVITSLFFYAWWEPVYLLVLLASIGFNFLCGVALERRHRKAVLVFGIAINLLLLGYFKYTNFFIQTLDQIGGFSFQPLTIGFPLAISFFTFTQIAFLIDAYRGKVEEYSLIDYMLFVTFFPHLPAGPIVHHSELMPQFRQQSLVSPMSENMAIGLTILIIGLCKKVILADTIGAYADLVFGSAASGTSPAFLEAWVGVVAYAFQIYFDFSGYSDMAIGIAKMMGITLPENFNAPYRSASIRDFWRRWHMTLSRFLQEYLYIPLGGNRRGEVRTLLNLFLTMLLAGLWHGAGWTFVAWGGIHGLYLMIHRIWTKASGHYVLRPLAFIVRFLAVPLTFFAVTVAWTFFRADTLTTAMMMLGSMFGWQGVTLSFQDSLLATPHVWKRAVQMIVVLMAIVWLAPTTQEFLGTDPKASSPAATRDAFVLPIRWKPTAFFAFCTVIIATVSVTSLFLAQEHVFLYFQF
jgi:D-alanyl-lipoteichoic acid acyltransferase DltB (MBOAT superfamily)